MSATLGSWIYTSFRRTKRKFQRFQRPAHYSFEPLDSGAASTALLQDGCVSTTRNSLDVDVGILDSVNSGPDNTSGLVNDSSMLDKDEEPSQMESSGETLPSTPSASSSKKRNKKLFLSIRKKKKDSPLRKMDVKDQKEGRSSETIEPEKLVDYKEETEKLRQELSNLKTELVKSQDSYKRLAQREKILQDRLAAQALYVLEKSGKFENINSVELRPSQIVTMFEELYSQARVDAMDALDELPELEELDDLKTKILYSVIVLSFRAAQRALESLKGKIRLTLHMPNTDQEEDEDEDDFSPQHQRRLLAKGIEDVIGDWLRKTALEFELLDCLAEVKEQLQATLFDFPSLKNCPALTTFIASAISIAWCCSVQSPPLIIEYTTLDFKTEFHSRFITADAENEKIVSYVWPGLLDEETGTCLSRAVVIT